MSCRQGSIDAVTGLDSKEHEEQEDAVCVCSHAMQL